MCMATSSSQQLATREGWGSDQQPAQCTSGQRSQTNCQDCMSCSSSVTGSGLWGDCSEGPLSPPSVDQQAIDSASDVTNALYVRQDESKFCCAYLSSTQACTGITAGQRASVVDNIVGAAASLALDNDSLFLAVALLDRYLAARPAPLHLLQPTGIACLWAAAKYEQCRIPASHAFSQLILGRNGVPLGAVPAAQQLLVVLEQAVLSAVDFRLASIITPKAFKHCIMHRLCASSAAQQLSSQQLDQLYCMVSYLSEIALLEYQLLPVQPSKLAAAAFGYAHVVLGIPLAVETLQQLTQHSAEQIAQPMEYMCALHATLSAALKLGRPYAVTVKYCDVQVCSVAALQAVVSTADARVDASW